MTSLAHQVSRLVGLILLATLPFAVSACVTATEPTPYPTYTPAPTPTSAPEISDDDLISNLIMCFEQNPLLWAIVKKGLLEGLAEKGTSTESVEELTPEDVRWILKLAIAGDSTVRDGLWDILSACEQSEPSPTSEVIGRYYKGRILHISVAAMERTDELRWTTATRYPAQGVTDAPLYRLAPASDKNELALLRVKVENHTTAKVIVNIDHEAAQLRDSFNGSYYPIDVGERAQHADISENPSDRCNVPVDPDSPNECVEFLWNSSYEETQPDGEVKIIQRAQELPKGTGLDGWMVFEVPKDTQLRSFRWSAGDTITIDFWVDPHPSTKITPPGTP